MPRISRRQLKPIPDQVPPAAAVVEPAVVEPVIDDTPEVEFYTGVDVGETPFDYDE